MFPTWASYNTMCYFSQTELIIFQLHRHYHRIAIGSPCFCFSPPRSTVLFRSPANRGEILTTKGESALRVTRNQQRRGREPSIAPRCDFVIRFMATRSRTSGSRPARSSALITAFIRSAGKIRRKNPRPATSTGAENAYQRNEKPTTLRRNLPIVLRFNSPFSTHTHTHTRTHGTVNTFFFFFFSVLPSPS